MRIVDAVTFEVVLRNNPESMLLLKRTTDLMIVAYHAKCMARKNPNIGKTIAATTASYHVIVMDDTGPQMPCRYCQPEFYAYGHMS